MKLLLLTKNQMLEKAVKDNLLNIEIDIIHDEQALKDGSADLLVIDGSLLQVSALATVNLTAYPRIAYLTQDERQANAKINGIIMVPYDGRPADALDALRKLIVGMTVHRNVLTFWSPVAGAGTTTVALTLYSHIPDNYRGLFLSLTDMPGIEYKSGGVDGYLSDVLPRLIAGVLDIEELVSACKTEGSKCYLAGLNTLVDVPTYSVDEVKNLISMAAAHFDYVVIDAGNGASLMGIAALSVSANSYVITTQSPTAAMKFEQIFRQCYSVVPEISTDRLRLIPNIDDKDVVIASRAQRSYNLNVLGSLRAVDRTVALRAEFDAALIYDLDTGSGYRADMDSLIGGIFADIGIVDGFARQKPKGKIFSFMRSGR